MRKPCLVKWPARAASAGLRKTSSKANAAEAAAALTPALLGVLMWPREAFAQDSKLTTRHKANALSSGVSGDEHRLVNGSTCTT